jgi:hypothetical protein
MRFEATQIKRYPEPLRTKDLRIGEIYFRVAFFDNEMLVPGLEPLIYIGANLRAEQEDSAYFQDAGSYEAGIRFGDDSGQYEGEFQFFPSKNLGCIFDFNGALNVILLCSLRREARK